MKNTLLSRRNANKVLFALFILFCSSFLFFGCKQVTDTDSDESEVIPSELGTLSSTDDLIGTWDGSYSGEYYTITTTTFDNGYYAGDNLYVYETSSTAGYIYFKYTTAMKDDGSYEYSSDSSEAPDVGNWYAVAYKDLTSTSVSLSAAYLSSGETSTDTLAEAVSEFTIANGYFTYYSDCTKEE